MLKLKLIILFQITVAVSVTDSSILRVKNLSNIYINRQRELQDFQVDLRSPTVSIKRRRDILPSYIDEESAQKFNLKCRCNPPKCTCCVVVIIDDSPFRERLCFVFSYHHVFSAIHIRTQIDKNQVEEEVMHESALEYCVERAKDIKELQEIPNYCAYFYNATRMKNMLGGRDKLNICFKLVGSLGQITLFIVTYDCITIGGDEFGIWKPVDNNYMDIFYSPPSIASEVAQKIIVRSTEVEKK